MPPGSPLDHAASCPQCGAAIAFRVASAAAQVCPYCRFVVVRTDRDLRAVGRVAELVDLPNPLPVGATGAIEGRRFRVAGRAQYDRAGAAGAPWQELFVAWDDGAWSWLAEAQGRWYLTDVAAQGAAPISWEQARPGLALAGPRGEPLVVAERGQRRMIAGEGELPFAVVPGEVERYVDLSGPEGLFGTLDLVAPPVLYLGREIDRAAIATDPGVAPVEKKEVATTALACPGCGAAIPLAVPDRAERVVCPYCRLQSDVTRGALVALKQLPEPPSPPEIPLGATGRLRGRDVTCIAFLVRSCVVDDETYPWREYLLWEPRQGFVWLVEEDGAWQLVQPIAAGDVSTPDGGRTQLYKAHAYRFEQSVEARVDWVLGELYWRVEVGERVQASTWKDEAGRTIGEESSANEAVWSYGSPIDGAEIRGAFGLEKLSAPRVVPVARLATTWVAMLVAWAIVTAWVVAGRENRVVWSKELDPTHLALPGTPEATIFSEPFEIEKDRRTVAIDLAVPDLSNGWVAGDVALISELDGTVEEASLNVEYWSGVDGGEAWSEGSRSDTAWFSRVRSGRYVLRFEPEVDPNARLPKAHLTVRSDAARGLYVALSLLVLLLVLGAGTLVSVRAAKEGSS